MGRASVEGRLICPIGANGEMERRAAHRRIDRRTGGTASARGVSMGKMRILLHYAAGPAWRRELALLSGRGIDVECCDESDDARFYSLLPHAEVLWHLLRPLSGNDIAKASNLRLIQKIGVGVNTIDLEAAKARDIRVCNMPGTNSRAVAEMTLLLILACLRRLPILDQATREGRGWKLDSNLQDSYGELAEKTVGLVGFGA